MSTSAYIPPHLRNRKRPSENLKKEEKPIIVESEFPSISAQSATTRTFKGPSFLSMAASVPEALPAPHKNPELRIHQKPVIRRRNFRSMTTEYYPEEEEPEVLLPKEEPVQEEWTTIQRKVHVKKDRVQEALETGNLNYGEEEDKSAWSDEQQEYEDSFWIDRKY